MATEIVRWCDVCMTSDERVPGAAHALQLDSKSGTVDLCPQHAKVLLSPLLEALAPAAKVATTRASSGSGRKPEPGPADCLVCGVAMRTDRMSAHLNNMHRLSVADVYGLTCPACDQTLASPSGAGSHARMHGVESGGLVGLWVRVDQAGDPDGKIAQRRLVLAEVRAT